MRRGTTVPPSPQVLTLKQVASWDGPPLILFAGVSTGGSVVHAVFGSWAAALGRPWRLAGIDLPPSTPAGTTFGDLTTAERTALPWLEHSAEWDSGYSKEHVTRPQTIGYGLVDSPAALCAWIIEKFRAAHRT